MLLHRQKKRRASTDAEEGDVTVKIIIDAMGGDLAPRVNTDGAVDALQAFQDIEIILMGPEEEVKASLESYPDKTKLDSVRSRLTVIDAPEVITTEEHPVMALRRKKKSAFVMGMNMIRSKEADAFVSAGSTGAVMSGGLLVLRTVKGIKRPALATQVPVPGRPMLLVDSGANTDCKPEWLVQFAMMGSIYMQKVNGVKDPQVGLLNIGTEEAKGDELTQQAFTLMKQKQPFTFAGNIEAREALSGSCDVLVADGFAGNVLLKGIEGTVSTLFRLMKGALMSSTKGKIAGLLAKDTFKQLKGTFDATEVGGAPLLGCDGVVIKAHGNSNARAIFCAIRQARTIVNEGVVELIRNGVAEITVEQEEKE